MGAPLSLATKMRLAAATRGMSVAEYLVACGIDDVEAEALRWDWRGFWARPAYRKNDGRYPDEWGGQLPPSSSWLTWLMLTGRGFGKTRSAAEEVRYRAVTEPGIRIAIVGQDPGDVWRVMLTGKSGLLTISPPHERPVYSSTTRTLSWPNGSIGSVFSGHNIEELRGPEFSLMWLDELMAFPKPEEAWDLAIAANRIPSPKGYPPRQIVTTTPRPSKKLKQIANLSTTSVTTGSTFDNADNLAPSFLSVLREMFDGTRYGEQELKGIQLDEIDGALFSEGLIARCRVADYPDLVRIVVAMDPSANDGKGGAEAGVVVAGVDATGKLYMLEDVSGRYSPDQWARAAASAFRRWDADVVVAEANNGGEMIRTLLAHVDPSIHVDLLHARATKLDRARPVSQLTERGRIFFVGTFDALEDQLTTYNGKGESPDRMDAFVWAVRYLARDAIDAVGQSFV